MAFYIPKTDAATLSDGGSFIGKSGIYDVTLKVVSVKVNEHNARSLDFNVDYQGSTQVFYGLKLDNNDGSPNFEARIFDKLCAIAGVETVSDPEVQEHKLGKNQTPTDLAVLTDFTDLPVKIRVQFEYSIWKSEIQEKRLIKAFYREDGASAAEIVNKTETGVQLGKDMNYADNITYKDGLTPEAVAEWKANKGNSSAPKPATAPKANEFAKAPTTQFPA